MKRLAACLALALLAVAPLSARAEEVIAKDGSSRSSFESPRDFVLELNGGRFRPNIDSQPGLSGHPYQDIFGKNEMWMFGAEFDWELWQGLGSLSVAFAADYAWVNGTGVFANTGEKSKDSTSLNTIPLRLLAVYRFDWLARRFNIPIIPFGKVGLAHTIWWSTNGNGAITRYGNDQALGGKWGYQLAGGLALELNWIDETLSREFDQEIGVNSAFIHVEYLYVSANNFGKVGLDLSTSSFVIGLGFEF
jgi:hypothetical protein